MALSQSILNNCLIIFVFILVLSRAVALGLTAEDMMNVYEYQENLKEQKKVKEMETSTAEVIKREVVHQQMDAQVSAEESKHEIESVVVIEEMI